MAPVRNPTMEAEIAALKFAAERAGTALACLFSSSAEYEADLIRERRAKGVYGPPARSRSVLRLSVLILLLALAFLLL
jgi:hypothetical protein